MDKRSRTITTCDPTGLAQTVLVTESENAWAVQDKGNEEVVSIPKDPARVGSDFEMDDVLQRYRNRGVMHTAGK